MKRRNFFGILATPLLRRFTPSVPMATGGLVPSDAPAMLQAGEVLIPAAASKAAFAAYTAHMKMKPQPFFS